MFFILLLAIFAVLYLQIMLSIKSYKESQAALNNDISYLLSDALENYYLYDAKEEFFTVVDMIPQRAFKSFAEDIRFDTLKHQPIDSVAIVQGGKTRKTSISSYQIFKGRIAADSIAKIKNKTNTIYFPLQKETLNIHLLQKRLNEGLKNKGIPLNYSLVFSKQDSLPKIASHGTTQLLVDTIWAKSTYLPEKSNLQLRYAKPVPLVWKKSLNSILLSGVFSMLIIVSLFYLLRVIRLQKNNAETRDDFVSNITHEFKTPITTALSALEATTKYNGVGDQEKTSNYIRTAQESLLKLNYLSDKILDTAAMENNQLILQLRSKNIVDSIQSIVTKYQKSHLDKTLLLSYNQPEIITDIDEFYFENAIENIIENAIKYGGNIIKIVITNDDLHLSITISDNGAGIDKTKTSYIFDKFYRIPKGNIHEVKGFGIGLYHSKKIVESHGGHLQLINNHPVVFEIIIPHV